MVQSPSLLQPLYEQPITDILLTEASTQYGNENIPESQSLRYCTLCKKVLSTKSALTRHGKMHARRLLKELRAARQPKLRIYTCKDCEQKFKQKRQLNKHAKQHIKLFMCTMCQRTFPDRLALDLHETLEGLDPKIRNKAPAYCTRSRSRMSCSGTLRPSSYDGGFFSMRATSPDSQSDCESELLSVRMARSRATSEPQRRKARSVETWVRTKRYSFDSATSLRSFSPASSMWSSARSDTSYASHCIYMCSHPTCSKTFPSLNWLTAHEMADHKMLALFRCKECRKRFTTSDNLRRHRINNHPNVMICVLCDLAQKGIAAIDQHFEMHRRYSVKCNVCGKLFTSYMYLQQHLHTVHPDHHMRPCFKGEILERFDKRETRRFTSVHDIFKQHFDPDLGTIHYSSSHPQHTLTYTHSHEFVADLPWRT